MKYFLLTLLSCSTLLAESPTLAAAKQNLLSAYKAEIKLAKHAKNTAEVNRLKLEMAKVGEAFKPDDLPDNSNAKFEELRVKKFELTTKNGWLNTKIKVKAGQRVLIKSKGTISPNGKLKCDANGVNRVDWKKYNIAPDYSHCALIAYIDSAENDFYNVGEQGDFMVKSSGFLYLGVNDKDARNNSGELTISVTY